jgi:hypothetical protein
MSVKLDIMHMTKDSTSGSPGPRDRPDELQTLREENSRLRELLRTFFMTFEGGLEDLLRVRKRMSAAVDEFGDD